MPEPIERVPTASRGVARRRLGLEPHSGPWLVAAGRQDGRKGADLAIDAFLRLDPRLGARLLLAGTIGEIARERLDGPARAAVVEGRIVVRDAFLDEPTLHDALCAADVVLLPYRTPYQSSGLLLRAAIHGRFVLTDRRGYLGDTVRRHSLGVACDVLDPDALDAGLAEAIRRGPRFVAPEAAESLAMRHNRDAVAGVWMRGIDRARAARDDRGG